MAPDEQLLQLPDLYADDPTAEADQYPIDYPYNIIALMVIILVIVLLFGLILFRIDWEYRVIERRSQIVVQMTEGDVAVALQDALFTLQNHDLSQESERLNVVERILRDPQTYQRYLASPEALAQGRAELVLVRASLHESLAWKPDPQAQVRSVLQAHRVPVGLWPRVYALRETAAPRRLQAFRNSLRARDSALESLAGMLAYMGKAQGRYRFEGGDIIFDTQELSDDYNQLVLAAEGMTTRLSAADTAFDRILDQLEAEATALVEEVRHAP